MKYVLVTGANGGMGRAAVRTLTAMGFGVFALDQRWEAGATDENVIPLQVDITDETAVRQAAERVGQITKELYAIVHYAGIYRLNSLVEIPFEEFALAFRVNVFGAFLVNRTFCPFLRPGSRIVMTTSELAPLDPLPFTGLYAVTKASLDKYAYALRMELQLLDVSVSVIRAGAVKTGMLGVSTGELEKFQADTRLYSYNAERFRRIVDRVEAKSVRPEKIAVLTGKILQKRNPKFVYSINRNPLLLLLHALPKRMQLFVIRRILKEPKRNRK